MATLPDIVTGSTVSAAPEVREEAQTIGRAGQVFQEGLTAAGQEVVKSQTIDAHLAYAQKADAIDSELTKTPTFTKEALISRIGEEGWSKLPPEVRAMPETMVPTLAPKIGPDGKPELDMWGQPVMYPQVDPKTGLPVQHPKEIPTYYVAKALHDQATEQAIADASKHITATPWQVPFQQAVRADAEQRWSRINNQMMEAWHRDMQDSRSLQIFSLARSGRFEEANAVIAGSRAIYGDDKQKEIFAQVAGMQQAKPVLEALEQFHLHPHDPDNLQRLAEAGARLTDPKQTGMMKEEHKASLATAIYRATRQAQNIDKGAALKASGQAATDAIFKDPSISFAGALEQVTKIADPAVRDEAERRVKEHFQALREARNFDDDPKVARLEARILDRNSLDRTSTDWTTLSDEGQKRVLATLDAHQRSLRSEATDERRQQREHDETVLKTFQAMDPEVRAKVDVDHDELFKSMSPLFKAEARKEVADAKRKMQTGEWVDERAFREHVRTIGEGMNLAGAPGNVQTDFGKFHDAMLNAWKEEQRKHPGSKALPPEVEAKVLQPFIVKGRAGSPYWFKHEAYGYENPRNFEPGEDQPGIEAARRLGIPVEGPGTGTQPPKPAEPQLPPTRPGYDRVEGPGGQTGQVPTGRALPPGWKRVK